MNKSTALVNSTMLREYAYSLFIAMGSLVVIYFCFGLYYGWGDDLCILQSLQGMFTDGVVINDIFEQLRLLSKLLSACYHLYPNVAWAGWMLTLFNMMALANFVFCIRLSLAGDFRVIGILFAFIVSFLLADNFVLSTFTRTAILLTGSALPAFIILLHKEKRKGWRILFGLLFFLQFFLGLLVRWEVCFLVFAMAPILIIYFFPGKAGMADKIKTVGWLGGLVTLLVAVNFFLETPDKKKHDEKWRLITNLLDGGHYANIENIEGGDTNDMRLIALKRWFFQDDKIITREYLESLSVKSFSDLFDANRVYLKFRGEAGRAMYLYNGYSPFFNYFSRLFAMFFFELFFIISFGFGLVFKKIDHRTFITLFLLWFFFWFSIVLITVVFKMEGRFFLPYAALHILFLFVIACEGLRKVQSQRWFARMLLILSIFISFFQFRALSGMVRCKKMEIANSASFRNYLHQHYAGQTLSFDYWTMLLFQDQLWYNTVPDSSYRRINYGEFIDNQHTAYRKRLTELTGGTDLLNYFRYCAKNNVVFVITDFRKSLFEKYIYRFYRKKFTFKLIDPDNPVYSIHYDLLPYYYSFGVYEIKEVD